MNLKVRLTIMNFLEFAVWGAYLTSMGTYLANAGFGSIIGWFYSIQGIVSIFMPGIMGVVADRWVQAQRLLSICHLVAGAFMAATGIYGLNEGCDISILFTLYSVSVAFFMPTLALSNSVAFNALVNAGMDTVKDFPSIRVFGTIGFICTMWLVDICGFQPTSQQFVVSGALSLALAAYSLTLPAVPTKVVDGTSADSETLVQKLGLDAIQLFKKKEMAIFFIFSMFLGVSLQITNGYANPYITSFQGIAEFADTFGAQHANILISLSQISETCCILFIPFFLKRFGIKNVMMIAMGAWVLRFGLFGTGDPGMGVWMFILSCIVYGVAFDFFNISGALFVDKSTNSEIRSSAQGLFMIMTNGLGATIGTLSAQTIVNEFVFSQPENVQLDGWRTCWFIFAGYAFVVLVLFAIIFHPKHHESAGAYKA
ncbi:MAG: MFS transporter [Prevotella sp.]|nr:MFS transporter [Prevotella sp.]MDE6151266.1 MFS transporter [Prevotella sp.]